MELLEAHKYLYKVSAKSYHNRNDKDKGWQEIASSMAILTHCHSDRSVSMLRVVFTSFCYGFFFVFVRSRLITRNFRLGGLDP